MMYYNIIHHGITKTHFSWKSVICGYIKIEKSEISNWFGTKWYVGVPAGGGGAGGHGVPDVGEIKILLDFLTWLKMLLFDFVSYRNILWLILFILIIYFAIKIFYNLYIVNFCYHYI